MPVSVFCCVLQGSGVTPLKYDEIADVGFIADFMETTTVKTIENRSTFVKLMDECIVAQFLLRHGVLTVVIINST